ncbi:hypothetical protein ZIOFF_010140 [Zingiber officinale]|uniref:Reverse transcriptase domain-containing protein n=1 Tax=Zingiber officinale TaxID=94328 RepID=A0A8J5LRX3_ZINOF|nr:hypothetical protein ZIOFF_010140 [Zingiber officinale]
MAEFKAPRCLSNQPTCIVSILEERTHIKKPYKFYNMWTTHEDLNRLVDRGWEQANELDHTAQCRLKLKLNLLKRDLKQLNKQHFHHISEKAARGRFTEVEYLFYLQHAKYKYFKEVDRNTAFFHSPVKRNNKKRKIMTVEKNNGEVNTAFAQVMKEFTDHFQFQLGVPIEKTPIQMSCMQYGRLLTTKQQSSLIIIPTEEEIKKALFNIGDQKVPRRDGPISYSTVYYKVISKLLAAHLADEADHLLHPAQIAFVKGTTIMDNIHLAQELLRNYNRKRLSPRCILKVDLQKVFNSCEHLRIAHLAYADDLLLLARGHIPSVTILATCLASFGEMTNLYANLVKSCIYMARVEKPNFDHHELLNTLSYAGKEQLITSVRQEVECFWKSILSLSCSVIDHIYSLLKGYMWAIKHPLIAWAKLCKPKAEKRGER